jgi:hypothetical protein
MLKADLLRLLQQEIRKHNFDCFVDEPPSMAQGGRGVVVPGCPRCTETTPDDESVHGPSCRGRVAKNYRTPELRFASLTVCMQILAYSAVVILPSKTGLFTSGYLPSISSG